VQLAKKLPGAVLIPDIDERLCKRGKLADLFLRRPVVKFGHQRLEPRRRLFAVAGHSVNVQRQRSADVDAAPVLAVGERETLVKRVDDISEFGRAVELGGAHQRTDQNWRGMGELDHRIMLTATAVRSGMLEIEDCRARRAFDRARCHRASRLELPEKRADAVRMKLEGAQHIAARYFDLARLFTEPGAEFGMFEHRFGHKSGYAISDLAIEQRDRGSREGREDRSRDLQLAQASRPKRDGPPLAVGDRSKFRVRNDFPEQASL